MNAAKGKLPNLLRIADIQLLPTLCERVWDQREWTRW